jgi:hypothetical protein
MCEACAFEIAPFRPVVTDSSGSVYQGDPLYKRPLRQKHRSPEEVTLRTVCHALCLAYEGLQSDIGYNWEESYDTPDDLRLNLACDIVLLLTEIEFYAFDVDAMIPPDCLNIHLPAVTEKLLLRLAPDPFLDVLLYASRALQAPDPRIARRYAVQSLRQVSDFYSLDCNLRFAVATPENETPARRSSYRKRGGIL